MMSLVQVDTRVRVQLVPKQRHIAADASGGIESWESTKSSPRDAVSSQKSEAPQVCLVGNAK